MTEIIVYFACLEPCDVVSDQQKNACLIGLFEAKPLETVCHWARTSHLRTAQNTAGTTCSAHCLLSHIVGGFSWPFFSFALSVMHGTDIIILRNPIFFSHVYFL